MDKCSASTPFRRGTCSGKTLVGTRTRRGRKKPSGADTWRTFVVSCRLARKSSASCRPRPVDLKYVPGQRLRDACVVNKQRLDVIFYAHTLCRNFTACSFPITPGWASHIDGRICQIHTLILAVSWLSSCRRMWMVPCSKGNTRCARHSTMRGRFRV